MSEHINENLKEILQRMLDEIEDLRAHQAVTSLALSALRELSSTDLSALQKGVVQKNSENYAALRRTIAEI